MTKKKNNTGKELQPQPGKEKRANTTGFKIPYPYVLLALVVLALYGASVNLGFTELDDSIFIKETSNYNKDISNLVTSFKRGVFNVTEDVYYRPLLLDSFVLNYQLSGINIKGYHVVNILFHLVSVLLLFLLLKKLRLQEPQAFLLTLLFAVHPVLSQAVVWIPGRNDTLLAIFTFSFFICAINYSDEGKTSWLLLQFVMLVLAFFTKETAVFAMPVAFIMLLFLLGTKWLERKNIILYVSWVLAFAFWILIRSQATLKNEQMQLTQVIAALPFRLPVLLQYLGKIILPVNLSVFPIMKDTPYIFGILAVLLLSAGIYFSKKKNVNVIVAGITIYILFLLPALLVPSSLNDQDFEHRLYLPIIGILILLTQTVLFQNNLETRRWFFYGIALCFILAIVNFFHQQKFSDPITFWKEAVRTSPHSAYANMMLGARLDKEDPARGQALIRTAYALNPDEKYLNYYMGKMMLDKDSVTAAEKFFEKEIAKSDYYECYFHMARIAFTKNDFAKAIEYLNIYLSKAPADPQANNNLLLLYMQTNQRDRAKMHVQKMQQMGLDVPADILRQLNL